MPRSLTKGSSSPPRRRRATLGFARGVTLIEMLIVVAIVGIIAAIAVPNLTPVTQRQQLHTSTEAVSALLDRARRAAFGDGRCTRITLVGDALELRSKTGSDGANCFGNLSGASWDRRLAVVRPERGVTFALSSTTSGSIVFRPNGRLRGDGDLTVTDDGAQIEVVHTALGAGMAVQVTPLGRVCKKPFTPGSPPAVTGALSCP